MMKTPQLTDTGVPTATPTMSDSTTVVATEGRSGKRGRVYSIPTTYRLQLLGNAVHWAHATHVVTRLLKHVDKKCVRVLELFAGTGALTRCLLEVATASEVAVALTVVVDNGKHAAAVMRRQHPHATVLEQSVTDMTFVSGSYDIVIAGPPCQDYSVANQKRDRTLSGVELARGALLPFAAQAIAGIDPAAWVIENVVMSEKERRVTTPDGDVISMPSDFAAADAAIKRALPDCLPAVKLDAAKDLGALMRRMRTFWANVDLNNPEQQPAQPWEATVEELAADGTPAEWTRRCKRGRGDA